MEASVQEDRKVDWSVLDAEAAYLILIKKPRGELKHLIYELQPELWKVERALNVPVYESLKLEKGWALKSTHELAEIAAIILPSLERAKRELALMEAEYGKAEDARKDIEAKVREYEKLCKEAHVVPTFLFPKGFRFMNPHELQRYLRAANGCVEYALERVAGKKVEAETRQRNEAEAVVRRAEEQALYAAIDAKRKERKAQIDREIASYKDAVAKLNEHPVFRMACLKAVSLYPVLDSDYRLVRMNDAEFDALLATSRGKVVAAMRSLREPLRRAWQSAQSRGVTRLGFQEYLEQEGVTLP